MSVQAMARVMEHSDMTGVARLVMLVIANHETEDRGAFPSIERLAHETRAGIRTVQEAIRKAAKAGELEVAYRQGPHGTNLYRTLCGLGTTARLPGTEPTRIRTPHNPHPADNGRESAPELKELGVRGSSTASSSSHPTFGFAEFYAVYPRHEKPREAERAYKQALKRATAEQILAGAIRYAEDPNLPADKSFISHPASWLNGDGWLSEPLPARVNGHQRETQEQRLARLAEGM